MHGGNISHRGKAASAAASSPPKLGSGSSGSFDNDEGNAGNGGGGGSSDIPNGSSSTATTTGGDGDDSKRGGRGGSRSMMWQFRRCILASRSQAGGGASSAGSGTPGKPKIWRGIASFVGIMVFIQMVTRYEYHQPSMISTTMSPPPPHPRLLHCLFDDFGDVQQQRKCQQPVFKQGGGEPLQIRHRTNEGYYQENRKDDKPKKKPKKYKSAKLKADPFETDECKAMHEWQRRSYPTCNAILEIDLVHWLGRQDLDTRMVANGHYRDVWHIYDGYDEKDYALKVFRYQHDYIERNYDRHRRDHLAYERLTFSPHVVDMYAFCANSGIFEYSTGGDIYGFLDVSTGHSDDDDDESGSDNDDAYKGVSSTFLNTPKLTRLKLALDVAAGMADMHDTEHDGRPTIAHTDIRLDQFIMIDDTFKLNDFNRARLLRVNQTNGETCGFTVGKNAGKFRAPEEYRYDLEDEKVDIYSEGNIFYVLLTGKLPFDDKSTDEATEYIAKGGRPKLPKKILKSKDPVDRTLRKAMTMCHAQDPKQRATAREVSDYISQEFHRIERQMQESS